MPVSRWAFQDVSDIANPIHLLLIGLDIRWEQPRTWSRLSKTIGVPAEYTEVVYLCRDVIAPRRMECREILLSDIRSLFGGIPLSTLRATGLKPYLDSEMKNLNRGKIHDTMRSVLGQSR